MLTDHSFGGLTTVNTFLTRPNLFQTRFAMSPSLWSNDLELVAKMVKHLSSEASTTSFLFMNVAGTEGERMTAPLAKMKPLLEKHSSKYSNWHIDVYEAEGHMTTPVIGQLSAYRNYLKDWPLPYTEVLKSLDLIVKHADKVSKKYDYEIQPNEKKTTLGYHQRGEKILRTPLIPLNKSLSCTLIQRTLMIA